MTGTQLAQLQSATLDLIATLGDGTRVAIVSYGNGAQVALPFTADQNAITSTLSALPLSGTAALYSGVEAAANLVAEASGETLIVVASYGWDWGSTSTTTREASLAAIEASGAPVYVQSLVVFGEDVAYLGALSTTGTIHGLTRLAALPDAATLLSRDAVTRYTIELDRSLLALGEHQITLTIAGRSASASIVDDALLSVAITDAPSDSSPLTLLVTANDELAGTTLVATLDRNTISIAADNSITLDPWQYAPGDAAIEVRALLADQRIASVSTSITIPTLVPLITTETTADGSALVATLRSQPGAVDELTASIDGTTIGTSATATIEFPLPSEGIVSIEARAAGGAVLASSAIALEATPQITPQIDSTTEPATSPLYTVIAGGLLALALVTALVITRRRKHRPSTRALEAIAPPSSPDETAPPPVPHTPIELHPVGNCDIVISRHGQPEERRPLGPGAISIGASPLCDITLDGRDIRFVHAVIGPDGPSLRIHRFGPVKTEDETLVLGAMLVIGSTTLTVTGRGEQAGQTSDGIVAA
jgi:von Willebrand factor type A domain